jgi:cyclophilin family peptidyl-prolyl cis-trans isomerase
MRYYAFALMAAAVAVPALALAAEAEEQPLFDAAPYEEEEVMLEPSAEAGQLPAGTKVAALELEDGGIVEIQLLVDETPETAGNFVALVEDGFYDGIVFHRVVEDFVVQAGDARLVGRENPDITLALEPDEHECVRGAVSMARLARVDEETGRAVYGDTSPTQFFILKSDAPRLDPDFCVFGLVVTGMDVVDEIEQGDVIRRIRILTVGEEAADPAAAPD